MKRLISILITCLLLAGLLGSIPVSAAEGSLSVTASSTAVTVEETVTVTLTYDGGGNPIGGIQGSLTYDTNVFSYVTFSGTDIQVNGGAGIMRFLFTPSGADAPKTATVTFTFQSLVPGSCDFVAATAEFVNDTDYGDLGSADAKGSVTVTASNPTLSDNANLSKLTPSKGTLTPKFDPNVTKYTVTVPYDVKSVSFSAESEDPDAEIAITGKAAVEVGETNRVLTVTAPNGTTKKYHLTVIRKAAPSTTGTKPTTGTTTPLPAEDALEVEVDGKAMTILDTQAPVERPAGFKWSTLTINLVEVPALVNEQTGMILLYLTSSVATENGLYIYLKEEDVFQRYRPLSVQAEGYLIYDLPADQPAPAGVVAGTLLYEDHYVNVYRYEDPALSDFCILWATSADGESGWYTYDTKEKTLQRYHAIPVAEEDNPSPSTTQKPTRVTAKATTAKTTATKVSATSLQSILGDSRRVLFIGGIAIAGVAGITLLLILIRSLKGRKKGKH